MCGIDVRKGTEKGGAARRHIRAIGKKPDGAVISPPPYSAGRGLPPKSNLAEGGYFLKIETGHILEICLELSVVSFPKWTVLTFLRPPPPPKYGPRFMREAAPESWGRLDLIGVDRF